jgi:hypothetical protein
VFYPTALPYDIVDWRYAERLEGFMAKGYSCAMCRHWRRVGPRSAVGRCENDKSGHGFTKEDISCGGFEIVLVFEQREQPAAPVGR